MRSGAPCRCNALATLHVIDSKQPAATLLEQPPSPEQNEPHAFPSFTASVIEDVSAVVHGLPPHPIRAMAATQESNVDRLMELTFSVGNA